MDHTPRLWPRNIPATDPSSRDQILIVRSCDADANSGAIGETSIAFISFSCATLVYKAFAAVIDALLALETMSLEVSHRFTVLS